MGFPILPASNDLDSPAPIIIYSPSYGENKAEGPESWSEHIAFPSEFHLIHDTKLVPAENGLDMVLIAAFEGIVLLWFDENESKWEHHVVGSRDRPAARPGYIATCVSKAPKESRGSNLLSKMFGRASSVYTVKIGGREFEAFGIAGIGAPENQGVYVYSPTNFALGHFGKTEIMDQSAGQLAVAAFAEKNRLASSNMTSLRFLTLLLLLPAVTRDPPSVRINRLSLA
ncbi:hypothetical protein C8J56DRAFT_1057682 [Mycena floridula]|nr:hypothetical protein C8J56DRAFT_1057682 [Mycena floridula]